MLDLDNDRLTFNNEKPNDYTQSGSFQLLISTPKSDNVKAGDVAIQGILWMENQSWWLFSLRNFGLIYLYPNGKKKLSKGTINIKIAQEDIYLLYLIVQQCLNACSNLFLTLMLRISMMASGSYIPFLSIKVIWYILLYSRVCAIAASELFITLYKTGGMPTPNHDERQPELI